MAAIGYRLPGGDEHAERDIYRVLWLRGRQGVSINDGISGTYQSPLWATDFERGDA